MPLLSEIRFERLLRGALCARNTVLLVCAPGLRYQFYHQGFDKRKIVWLGVMEYYSADPRSTLRRLAELASADPNRNVMVKQICVLYFQMVVPLEQSTRK